MLLLGIRQRKKILWMLGIVYALSYGPILFFGILV